MLLDGLLTCSPGSEQSRVLMSGTVLTWLLLPSPRSPSSTSSSLSRHFQKMSRILRLKTELYKSPSSLNTRGSRSYTLWMTGAAGSPNSYFPRWRSCVCRARNRASFLPSFFFNAYPTAFILISHQTRPPVLPSQVLAASILVAGENSDWRCLFMAPFLMDSFLL